MRRGLALILMGVTLLGVVSAALAQQPGSSGAAVKDAAPWHVAKVLTLSRARPGDAAQPEAGPLKYLHVQVGFTAAAPERKMHKFRVTDERGNAVGDLWGYNDSESVLIYEGEQPWTNLAGLYLEGQGHREPLFKANPLTVRSTVAEARPAPVIHTPVPVRVETPVARVAQAPVTTVVQAPTTRVVTAPDRVVVQNPVVVPDRVIVENTVPSVIRDRVVVDEPRVVVDGPRVVVDRPATVVHRGST